LLRETNIWGSGLSGLGGQGYFGRRGWGVVGPDRLGTRQVLKNLACHWAVDFSVKGKRIEWEFFNRQGSDHFIASARAMAADNGSLGRVFSLAASIFLIMHTLAHLFFLPAATSARGPTLQRAAATIAITGAFAGNRMGNDCRLHGERQ